MTNDANLYYRGQAFEILLSITDCDSFDWFQPHDGSTTKKILQSRFLSLSDNPDFLSGLIENRKKSYPGGSFRALQLLAFWISWVRAMMTKNQVLNLSDKILEELYLWSEGGGEGEGNGVEYLDEEINLAKMIFQDFSYDQFHKDQPSGSGRICTERYQSKLLKYSPITCDNDSNNGKEDRNGNGNGSGFENAKKEKIMIERDSKNTFSEKEKSLLFVSGFQSPEMGVELMILPSAKEIAKMFPAESRSNELSRNNGSECHTVNNSISSNYEEISSRNNNDDNNKNDDNNNDNDNINDVYNSRTKKSSIISPNENVIISNGLVLSSSSSSSSPMSLLINEDSPKHSMESSLYSSDDDSLSLAQTLKVDGNELFKLLKYNEALLMYKKSLICLEPLYKKYFNCSSGGIISVNKEVTSDNNIVLINDVKILKVSLHYNCATVHWKLSEVKYNLEYNSSSSSSSCSRSSSFRNNLNIELQYCETACLLALELNSTHCKSIYRLSEVMLRLDRPKEALILIEKFSNASTEAIDETMKAIRRRCLAAVLTIDPSSVKGNQSNTTSYGNSTNTSIGNCSISSNSTSNSNSSGCSSVKSDDGTEVIDVEDDINLEPSIELRTPKTKNVTDTVTATMTATGQVDGRLGEGEGGIDITTATIGSQAAKHLRALQVRAERERNCNTHAWNGWLAPIEEAVLTGAEGMQDNKEKEKENEMKRENEDGSTNDENENENVSEKNEEEEEHSLGFHTLITVEATISTCTSNVLTTNTNSNDKNQILEEDEGKRKKKGQEEYPLLPTPVRVKGAKKAARLALEIEGNSKKINGSGGETRGKIIEDKITKKIIKITTSDNFDTYNNLKSLSVLFTKCYDTYSVMIKNDVLDEISEIDINTEKSTAFKDKDLKIVNNENALLENLYDQMDGFVQSAIKVS